MNEQEGRPIFNAASLAHWPPVWPIAFITAIVFAAPVALLRSWTPAAIAIPILAGSALCVCWELYPEKASQICARLFRRSSTGVGRIRESLGIPSFEFDHLEAPIERLPASFSNYEHVENVIVIELSSLETKRKKKPTKGADQLMLEIPVGPAAAPAHKKIRVFQMADGSELLAMDTDLFTARLNAELIEEFDRLFEASYSTSLARYASSNVSVDGLRLLGSPHTKRILCSDLRGNLATKVSGLGEKLVKLYIRELTQVTAAAEREKAERLQDEFSRIQAARRASSQSMFR